MEHGSVLLIPAYNPPSTLLDYAGRLIKAGFSEIIVVNDGSRTDKLPIFFRLERLGVIVLKHDENKGQGAAIKTGLSYYEDHFAEMRDGVITLNAARFYTVEDVRKIADVLASENEKNSEKLVLAERDLQGNGVSDYDYRMASLSKTIYHMLMGIQLDDPMSGVFGIPDSSILNCIDIPGEGYVYVTSLTMTIEKSGFVPVEVGYPSYEPERETKFKKVGDSFRILYTLAQQFVLYSLTSVIASIIDVIMFGIFTSTLFKGASLSIIYSTVLARVISATANYIMTKKFVFHFKSDSASGSTKNAGVFLLLMLGQCLASALFVTLLKSLIGGSAVGFKILTDIVLFFISYKIQHKYIFKDEKKPAQTPVQTES